MIHDIQIQNFLGIRDFSARLDKPVTLIAGPNKAGKSTIRDALRFALLDDPGRADKKKDYASLLSDGASNGVISVETDVGSVVRNVSSGKREGDLDVDALGPVVDVVLDADRFAAFPENERRRRLLEVTGVKPTREAIVERMQKRGLTSDGQAEKIETILPHLRGGFDAAHEQAKTLLRDAKRSWETITGEKYGANKADTWRPRAVAYDPKRIEELTEQRDARHERQGVLRETLGELKARIEAAGNPGEDAKLAKTVPAKLKTVEQLREELENKAHSLKAYRGEIEKAARSKAQFECPNCSAHLRLDPEDDNRLIEAGEASGTRPDVESLEETARDLALQVDTLEEDLRTAQHQHLEAEAAAKRVENADKAGNLDDLKLRRNDTQSELNDVSSELSGLEDMLAQAMRGKEASERAAEDEQHARDHHHHAQDWQAIVDALAPDGIPSELLAEALDPVNDRLREHAATTGWGQVRIEPDMRITVDGRVYRLLSESERWRADACIAETLSHLSGLGLLILDRLDVLDIPSRRPALDWLCGLGRDGEQQTLVMATLKSPPPESEYLAVHWLGEPMQAAA